MSESSTALIHSIWSACETGAEAIAQCLSRAFDRSFSLLVDKPRIGIAGELPPELNGRGLVIVLQISNEAVALVLAESTGILPSWYDNPDTTGKNKLAVLAQELGECCLPATISTMMQQTLHVANLAEAMEHAELATHGGYIPLRFTDSDGQVATSWLVSPLVNPIGVATAALPNEGAKPPEARVAARASVAEREGEYEATSPSPHLSGLPSYTRSLLKIRVPVAVSLANKRQAIGKIVDLGIGSIIHFDKKCEEMLDLEVNGLPVALGEPVKVGDKFGLRVTAIRLPPESFEPLQAPGS